MSPLFLVLTSLLPVLLRTSMQPDFSSMRYKYLWQAPIAVCTLSKVQPSPSIRRSRGNVSRQLEQLQQDMGTLHKLIDISKQLKYDHQVCYTVVMVFIVMVTVY